LLRFIGLVLSTAFFCIVLGTLTAGEGGALFGLIVGVLLIIYFIPSFIAYSRKCPSSNAIFALNLLLGFSGIGWVVSLVWALRNYKYSAPIRVLDSSKDK